MITLQHLKAMEKAKRLSQSTKGKEMDDQEASMKIPSFSYLLVDMLLFEYRDTLFIITTNEHGDVQMFDFETGMFQFEFKFDEVFKFEFKKKRKQIDDQFQSSQIIPNNGKA